jgi:hypothetical protein
VKNSIDKIYGSAVSVAQVALKPRVNGRNLTEIQVFLRPQYERTVGCGANTTPSLNQISNLIKKGNIPAVSIDGFKTPGNLESVILEQQWRSTMSTPLPVCPHELLSGCSTRLSFFTTLLISAINSDGSINWDNIQNQDGIYYTLHSIADDISTAQFIFEQRECVK